MEIEKSSTCALVLDQRASFYTRMYEYVLICTYASLGFETQVRISDRRKDYLATPYPTTSTKGDITPSFTISMKREVILSFVQDIKRDRT
jgi:hypothetical protein